ncbi:hypothetical protein EW146_g1183 [Bondarzewia mesenterica]|uniref:Phosphoglycerate mutase-like protein n=1 Tax=Bondarzewia mesenterica TaxID=1095465 RepID=A0A4S4M6W6_9AGAM|nr:hypothetical protein EW146_g1183 [Bondarzewia mesenterica]
MTTPTVFVTFIEWVTKVLQRTVWAGWEDAPLSNHGMNQARALGQFFADTQFTAIFASTLTRAFTTAHALHDGQKEPKPPLTPSLLLREQYFGVAEGKPWSIHQEEGLSLEDHYARGIYPVLHKDHEKFPGAESLHDLAERAKQAIRELVLPLVWRAANEGKKGVHIAVVSHGLCISRLIAELLKNDADGPDNGDYRGLLNTAWTRVAVNVVGSIEGELLECDGNNSPPLAIRVTDVNRHSHINDIKRQKGGIGSAAYDPKQADIRAFFGGKVQAQEHSESNANDEVGVELDS